MDLQFIFDGMPGYVAYFDMQGRHSLCNALYRRSLGISEKSCLVGKKFVELLAYAHHQTIASQCDANNEQVFKEYRDQRFEEKMLLEDGSVSFFISDRKLLKDSAGNVIGLLSISTDISNYKLQEEELIKKNDSDEMALSNIIANMPGHVYWKNEKGVYLGCNDAQAKSLGFQYGYEVIGKVDDELPWGRNQAKIFKKNDLRLMSTLVSEVFEEEAVVDDIKATVLSYKSPLRNSQGHAVGVLGISIDISDKKTIQKELMLAKKEADKLNQLKSEFIANMSHEAMTPLSGILGASELLQNQLHESADIEMAKNISLSANSLKKFFLDCLDLVRSEFLDIAVKIEVFKPKEIFTSLEYLYRSAAQLKGLVVIFQYDKNIPIQLFGPRLAFYRVIQNIVGNAIKFTDEGGKIDVHVKLGKKLSERCSVLEVSIKDTGIGIPKDKQEKIFEKMTRLSPSYQNLYEGSGLGLYFVKQLLSQIDGQVFVESEEGKGSRFIVSVPLSIPLTDKEEFEDDQTLYTTLSKSNPTVDHTKSTAPLSSTRPTNGHRTPTKKILIVEDHVMPQRLVVIALQVLGYDCDVADCGSVAIDLFKPGKYDFVYMDIGLPDLLGHDVAAKFREVEMKAGNLSTPIVAVTAHASDAIKKHCIACGMNGVTSKPFVGEKMMQVLARFVDGQDVEIDDFFDQRDVDALATVF